MAMQLGGTVPHVPDHPDLDLEDSPRKRPGEQSKQAGAPNKVKRSPPLAKGPGVGTDGSDGTSLANVTLGDLRSLLEEQSQKILAANRDHAEGLVRSLEERHDARLTEVESSTRTLSGSVESMQSRLERMEQLLKGGTHVLGDERRKQTLVFGGWARDTRRNVIVREMTEALTRLGLTTQVDEEVFTTGPRRSIALLNMPLRLHEQESSRKARMHRVLLAVNGAEAVTSSGKRLWCSYSKSKQERETGAHCAWVKRSLGSVSDDLAAAVDVEYATGSVWMGDSLVASVSRQPNTGAKSHEMMVDSNAETCKPWVDLGAFSRESKLGVDKLREILVANRTPEDRSVLKGDLLLLQELPRESQWRGTGLLFCKDEWSVLRKRPAGKGTWFKLRRLKVDLFVSQAPKEPDRLVVQGDAKALILLDRFARQEGRQGRQIDTVGARRLRTEGVTIFRDSYLTLGTDHELLCSSFRIVQGKGVTRFQTKPRVWTGGPPTLEYVDQTVLENLAAKCTRPQPSHAYRDPQAVKDLFRAAKSSKTRNAWKTALASRKAARQQWERQRESRALQGDWKAFQQSKVQAKQGWEIDFADRQSRDPHDVVHDHLSGIYKGQGSDIQPVYDTSQEVTAFTVEELQTALGQLKGSKSVGRDLTSKELLMGIVNTDGGQQHLLEFMNRTLATQRIPAEWNRHCMPYVSHAQCAGGQRQPSDVIFAIWRLLQLEREWKAGVVIAQIDIRKAFDTLCRRRLLQKLRAVLGNTPEYRCLHNLLCGTEATLQTVWGSSTFGMFTGIKQGATESPLLFSFIMEHALLETSLRCGWQHRPRLYPELECEDSLFMDDGLLWGRDVASLA
ncbi:unnamed protein product, partial [Symbiodinium sp. CCMP2456]